MTLLLWLLLVTTTTTEECFQVARWASGCPRVVLRLSSCEQKLLAVCNRLSDPFATPWRPFRGPFSP